MTHTPRPFYSLGGVNAETYDVRTETPAGEIEFYVARARASGGAVLELACGTGRVTWPIARAGVSVTGLDIEPAMLEQAEAKGAHESPEVRDRVRFVRGDMTEFSLDTEFALAIVPFRAFLLLLTVEQQRSALGAIRRHLRPGGGLIIDIFDPLYEMLVGQQSTPARKIPDFRHPRTGHTVSVTVPERTNDHLRQQLTERWRFREVAGDGTLVREEDELLTLRWIFRYEMRHLLELCGFEVEDELSDYLGAPPAYGREQIWIARRRYA
jgi:ubiquinone/menaquinone biosynthesis C-methylase UbiE